MSLSSETQALLDEILNSLGKYPVEMRTWGDTLRSNRLKDLCKLIEKAKQEPASALLREIGLLLRILARQLLGHERAKQELLATQLLRLVDDDKRHSTAVNDSRAASASSPLDIFAFFDRIEGISWIECPHGGYGVAAEGDAESQAVLLMIKPFLRSRRSGSLSTLFTYAASKRFDMINCALRDCALYHGEEWEVFQLEHGDHGHSATLLDLMFGEVTSPSDDYYQILENDLEHFYSEFHQPGSVPQIRREYLVPIKSALESLARTRPELISSRGDPAPLFVEHLRLRHPLSIVRELLHPDSLDKISQIASNSSSLIHGDLGAENILISELKGRELRTIDTCSGGLGDYLFDLSSLLVSCLGVGHVLRNSAIDNWILIGPDDRSKAFFFRFYHYGIEKNCLSLVETVCRLIRQLSFTLETPGLTRQEKLSNAQKRFLLALSYQFLTAAPRAGNSQRMLSLYGQGALLLNLFEYYLPLAGTIPLQDVLGDFIYQND